MGKSILFIDSGIGGLPYLAMARDRLPEEQFIYIADRAHFPYGTKKNEQIREAILGLVVRAIAALDPKIVVLACNTATMVAIDALRERFPVPFIGVVPAVKPAASLTRNGRIGVLASGRSVKDVYLEDLVRGHARDCDVQLIPADELIRFVETEYVCSAKEQILMVVEKTMKSLQDSGIDTLVLACTHFLVMEAEFRQVLGKKIRVVDSREGVVNQLVRVIEAKGLRENLRTGPRPGRSDRLYVTGDTEPEARYAIVAERFSLSLAGSL